MFNLNPIVYFIYTNMSFLQFLQNFIVCPQLFTCIEPIIITIKFHRLIHCYIGARIEKSPYIIGHVSLYMQALPIYAKTYSLFTSAIVDWVLFCTVNTSGAILFATNLSQFLAKSPHEFSVSIYLHSALHVH